MVPRRSTQGREMARATVLERSLILDLGLLSLAQQNEQLIRESAEPPHHE